MLAKLGLFLEHLDISHYEAVKQKVEVSDAKIAEVIRLNRRLTRIDIHQITEAATLTMGVIQDTCGMRLKTLNVGGVSRSLPRICKDSLHDTSRNAPDLQHRKQLRRGGAFGERHDDLGLGNSFSAAV